MVAELVFSPDVQTDIGEAYSWYEERRPGLGEEFLRCVEAALNTICRTPELYTKVYLDYRRTLIRRFPFSIFYEYENNKITVFCIFHTSQNPEKWRSRLM